MRSKQTSCVILAQVDGLIGRNVIYSA